MMYDVCMYIQNNNNKNRTKKKFKIGKNIMKLEFINKQTYVHIYLMHNF